VRSCKFSVAAVISTRRIYSTARCSGCLAMASYGKGLRAATRPGGVNTEVHAPTNQLYLWRRGREKTSLCKIWICYWNIYSNAAGWCTLCAVNLQNLVHCPRCCNAPNNNIAYTHYERLIVDVIITVRW